MVSFTSLAFSQDREPNNTFKEADKITGLVIDGNIEYPGDVDWFYLMRQEGKQNIKFSVTHTLPDDITRNPDTIIYSVYFSIILQKFIANSSRIFLLLIPLIIISYCFKSLYYFWIKY